MSKTITFLLATFISIISFAQTFEGTIVYKNTYKSKIANVSDAQLTAMMGSRQEYMIKNGAYKSVANGLLFQWQLYVSTDNKLYSKMANSDSLLWTNAGINPDEVLEAKLIDEETEILGYRCTGLILKCKSGTQKYYFSTKLPVDATLYVNHKFGNWYDFISRSKSLPLKAIIENEQLILENVATEVNRMELDNKVFELPANSSVKTNPY
jgi:hypothetical protein